MVAILTGLALGLPGTGLPGADPPRAGSAPRAAAPAVLDLPPYLRDGNQPYPMLLGDLPYETWPLAPVADPGPSDAAGVRLQPYRGQLHDHPVAQAQWGIQNLKTYRVRGDPRYLQRAVAQAQRNLDRRVESRGAWWYPYPFDLGGCGARPGLTAPWYSALAQGQLLSLFVRLQEITGEQRWRVAADRTFASLLLPPQAGSPWVSWVDGAGHLWLEEYPESAGVRGQRVFNGHGYAAFGVYDHWRLTGDPRATALLDGAASTVRRYLPTDVRSPGWISRYSIGCPTTSTSYHEMHTDQLLAFYRITHRPIFATFADQLRADYPRPALPNRLVRFAAGEHIGYRFAADGTIIGQQRLGLGRVSAAHTDQRIRILGRGIHYRIVDGGLAGWYVAEAAGARVLTGTVAQHVYRPLNRLTVPPGTYTAYRYDSAGTVTGSVTASFDRLSGVGVRATAWLNGHFGYLVAAGPLVDHWLPHRPGLGLV